MSNPTELPDLERQLFEAEAAKQRINIERSKPFPDRYKYEHAAFMWDFWQSARRAQPESEAPQASFGQEVTRLVAEIRKPCSMAWRDSLVEQLIELIDPSPAATLSPICGAQHAESGKEVAQAAKALLDCCDGLPIDTDEATAAALTAFDRTRASLRKALSAQQAAAPGTPEAPQPPFPVSDDEMAALRRFWECASDGEGYDVEKAMMQRLAEMGLVQRKSGAYYMVTEFGLYVLREYTIPRAAQLDGGQEGSDHA